MRNLRLVGEKHTVFSSEASYVDDAIVDASGSAFLTAFGNVWHGAKKRLCSLNPVCDVPSSEWNSLTLMDDHQYVALSRSGAIVSIVDGLAEQVGEFEHGILAAAWSPNRDRLVLVTQTESDAGQQQQQLQTVLLCMNSQWDVLAEVNIETVVATETVSVCWAASAQRLAVNSVDATDQQRKVRIYESEMLDCIAVGRTEDGSGKLAPNMQSTNIAWANSGCSNLIASIQRKGTKTTQVAFFEPNGLRHRECVLREDPNVQVSQLGWNFHSDLLAVVVQADALRKVQLWHRSNYHWYLKYEIRYSHAVSIQWHESSPYTLLVYSGMRCTEFCFHWDASNLHGTVAMAIDGANLNLTDYQVCFMPPPMYARTICCYLPVCQVAIAPAPLFGVVLLSDKSLIVLNQDQTIVARVSKLESSTFDGDSLRNIVVYHADGDSIRLLAIAASWENRHCDTLLDLSVRFSGDRTDAMSLQKSISLEGYCTCMVPWVDSDDGVLLQLDDGTLLEFDGELSASPAEPLLEPCPWMAAIKNPAPFTLNNEHPRQRLIVGMSSRNRLYCHDILVSNDVTSFTLSLDNEFLAFVASGSRCVLRFLSLHDLCNFDPLMGSDMNALLEGYEPRNVERGSRLVAVLSKKPSAVLQMPRGNIEIIYPRALVLRHVMLGIAQHKYKETFELMRRQKIDLNLIVDMNPCYFLEGNGIKDFVDQVEPIDYLNLFISGLQNWNSSVDRYVVPHWIHRGLNGGTETHGPPFDYTTKVNAVCRKLRHVLQAIETEGNTASGRTINEGHFLLPILSTFAKEEPPQLQAALDLIKGNTFRNVVSSSKKPPLFSDTAQSAIHYLAFLADYELLFNTALGSYDFEMARAVARNSQMDPKVYIPLLKRFKELPEYFGRFEVDMKLKRHDHALHNLSKSETVGETLPDMDGNDDKEGKTMRNNFDCCMQLIEDHDLYRLGLELFDDDMERKNRIMMALGDHLLERKEAKSALCVYMSADPLDTSRCIEAAKAAHDWSTLFQLVVPEQHQGVAIDVVASLESVAEFSNKKRELFAEAAKILIDYGQDIDNGVSYLVRAEKWSEAKRVASLHSREMVSRKVVDAAIAYSHSTIEDFSERQRSWETTRKRYLEVLPIRKEAIRTGEMQLGEELEHDDNGSQFSAASNMSNMSRSSTASTSSLGSLSSVISVKSTTTFTVTGREHEYRHKNKFNSKKVKKKRKHKGRTKTIPGSEKELQELVTALQTTCIEQSYCDRIADTILFLFHSKQINVAQALYESYDKLSKAIAESCFPAQLSSGEFDGITHPVEKKVAELKCAELPVMYRQLFELLPVT